VYLNQERRLAGFSRSKFESLVSSVQDVVFTLDRQCRHTGIYGKWSADRGVSEEAFLGKTAAEIMGAPGTRHMEMAQTAFREQRPVTYEWSARTQDGTQRFYQTTLSPILTQNESPAEVVGVGRDITDLKRTQHQLEESLREKSTLLREVHHRVKNNLQLIVSLLNLRAASSGDEGTQQVLSELKSRVMAMALVHEQLYQAENLASIAFKDYLTEIVASVAEASSSRDGLTPAVSISADELHLTVEQALPLGLIAVELISNAVKHAGPCRGALAIAISFAATDGFVTLSVADNGPGLPEGFDTQRSETLGLALVQSLASQLDGDLVVNSAHGACFAVTIPAVPAVGD
jgi:PAS domain S-box-containing protein